MKRFWEIKAREDAPESGIMQIYGEISDSSWYGDEVTPRQVVGELEALGEIRQLDVYINSPGGDVFAGLAIYNILKRRSERIVAHIDGLAASAASVIAMAAEEIIMPTGSMMMIHRAWSCACGNAEDMRGMADTLERIDGQLAQIYAGRGKISAERAEQLMSEETWLDGRDALEIGLCDRTEDAQAAACAIGPEMAARYKRIPQNYLDACNGGESQPAEDKDAAEPAAPAAAITEQRRSFAAARRKIMSIGGKDE